MTKKQELFHKSLVRAIHLSRRYKEYFKDERDEYLELLQEHFGVDSSTELSIEQLIVFVDYMNFKDVTLPTFRAKDNIHCTQAQLSMMRGLWKDRAREPTDENLLKFIYRQEKKRYLHLHMLSKIEAQKIIPALKVMSS